MNSVIFCRRLLSLRQSTFYPSPAVCIQYYGFLKYSINSVHKSPGYLSKLNQYDGTKYEFSDFKRCNQTSSKQRKSSEDISQNVEEPPEKLSLFKRYRKMLKEYWYVLLPVHFVTSPFWFGGFYYAAKCGIDIVPFLEYINLPEKFINPLRNSSLGYIAVASAMYKIATPARYMVTLGGTTFAIKFLTKRGLIRPAPTKAELKTIIQNKLKKDVNDKQP